MKISIEPQYFIFKYLWLIVLLPKQYMQLIFFSLIVLFLLPSYVNEKRNWEIDIPSFCIILWAIIYSISIISNSLFGNVSNQVLFSDLSKVFNWLIATFFYNYYLKKPVDINKIRNYMLFNLTVLAVFIGMFYIQKNANIVFLGRSLLGWDGFTASNHYGVRYAGFLEYATLNGQLIIFLLPLLRVVKIKFFTEIIILSFLLEVLILSKSRIAVISIILYIVFTVVDEINSTNKWIVITSAPITAFLMFSNWYNIKQILFQIFNSRSGSNATRFIVYEESLRAINGVGMLLGAGVRLPSSVGILLGSHSMYMSFIYRTGVLGSLIIFVMFCTLFSKFLTCNPSNKLRSVGYILALLVFWLFEELDPHYWCLILFFSTMSIFMSDRKEAMI